jgi:hypothetical protein
LLRRQQGRSHQHQAAEQSGMRQQAADALKGRGFSRAATRTKKDGL